MAKKRLLVLTGAGISAESGLKTFRDSDGLWEGYDIETVATPSAWEKDKALVLRFYNERRQNVQAAKPNAAHFALAELQQWFEVTIVTQNIDDLHERAGSNNILHLHGEILSRKSDRSGRLRERIERDMLLTEKAPDGGTWRPDIVWFQEPVPLIGAAAEMVGKADIFLVVGTSLQVYPAAGLIDLVPEGVPIFVVDRKIPRITQAGIEAIELPATEGMLQLTEILKQRYI